jgi:uncharacterized protein
MNSLVSVIATDTLDFKQSALMDALEELGSVIVAYSGGADSAYLAWAAQQALGDRAIAITADSASIPESHKRDAEEFARTCGFRHEYIETHEFDNPDYVKNGPDRCFHCKDELFARLDEVARERGIAHVVYGVNSDDLGDYRPGQGAAKLHQVKAPLVDAKLTKAEIRELSRRAGLKTWDRPASACLSSRIPYGTPVTIENVKTVEVGEEAIPAVPRALSRRPGADRDRSGRIGACSSTAYGPSVHCDFQAAWVSLRDLGLGRLSPRLPKRRDSLKHFCTWRTHSTRACRIDTRVDTSLGARKVSRRVSTRHAKLRAPRRASISRRRREHGHHHQPLRSQVADRMYHSRRSKSHIAGRQSLRLLADLHDPATLEHDVQFVLPLMRVRGVLLTGLEGVQSGEQKIAAHQSALAHFVGCETGETGGLFDKHRYLAGPGAGAGAANVAGSGQLPS